MAKHKRDIELLARGVYVHDGRLLICRNRKKGNWYLPGGHIEFGESAEKALLREVEEEMGLSCRIKRFLAAVEHTFVYKEKKTCELNIIFEIGFKDLVSTDTPPSLESQLQFIWFPMSKLYASKLNPAVVRRSLKGWLARPSSKYFWGSTYK